MPLSFLTYYSYHITNYNRISSYIIIASYTFVSIHYLSSYSTSTFLYYMYTLVLSFTGSFIVHCYIIYCVNYIILSTCIFIVDVSYWAYRPLFLLGLHIVYSIIMGYHAISSYLFLMGSTDFRRWNNIGQMSKTRSPHQS